MKRAACLMLTVSLLCGSVGCGSNGTGRGRKVAAGVLFGLAALAGGGAAAAGVISNRKERDLRADVEAGAVDGSQFAERDQSGIRWNRTGRASAFVAGLALVGLVVVWEMGVAAERQYGPAEQPTLEPIMPGSDPPPAAAAAIPGFIESRRTLAASSSSPARAAEPLRPQPAGPPR